EGRPSLAHDNAATTPRERVVATFGSDIEAEGSEDSSGPTGDLELERRPNTEPRLEPPHATDGQSEPPPAFDAPEPTGEDPEEPTDQGFAGAEEEITRSMGASALDEQTAPLELRPLIAEAELPRREIPRSTSETRRVAPDPEAGQQLGNY